LDIDGNRLHTFNNHWKSGASNAADEAIRVGNAKVLRKRLDQLLAQDPLADIVVGGDFNSQYNQAQAYPNMQQTALDQVAGSQGDEQAMCSIKGPTLYNLWYDVQPGRRGSDVYNGEWGTLMQMLISRGLYDHRGVQYVDNSFNKAALEGINCQAGSLAPVRWQLVDGEAAGFSDHLPVFAQFRLARDRNASGFMVLANPGKNDTATSKAPTVDYAATKRAKLRSTTEFENDAAVRRTENLGHAFQVKAVVSAEKPFKIRLMNEEYAVWSFDKDLRIKMYQKFPVGSNFEVIGELGIHEGKWQFVIRDPSWLTLP
jgi:hypothetical protein